jgi:uncharacterized protein (DUF362 family)
VSDHWNRRDVLRLGAGVSGALLAGLGGACGFRAAACRSVAPNPFQEGGRPLLVMVEGEDLSAMLRSGIEALGGLDKLAPLGREALLKGSYVAPQPYPVTTAADFVVAVADAFKAAGFRRTTLFESHGSHLSPGFAPETFMRRLGVLDQVTRQGVEVLAPDFFENDQFRPVRNPAWSIQQPVAVHRKLYDAGVVVGLPVVKRHGAARFTCALKLHFGSVSMADRLVAHKNEGRRGFFEQRLVHFADAVKPQLNVVDARAILARSGPTLSGGGEVVRGVNRIILCGDMVATDAYCARLMAERDPTFSTDMIDTQLRLAQDLGLGTADLARVKVVERRA